MGAFLNGGNLAHVGHGFLVGHQIGHGIEQGDDCFRVDVGHDSGGVVVQAHADIHRKADINEVFQDGCLIRAQIGGHHNNNAVRVLLLRVTRKLDGFFGVAVGHAKKRMDLALAVAGHVLDDGLFFFNGQGRGFAGGPQHQQGAGAVGGVKIHKIMHHTKVNGVIFGKGGNNRYPGTFRVNQLSHLQSPLMLCLRQQHGPARPCCSFYNMRR